MFMKAAVRAKRAQKRREAFQRRQAQQRLVFALTLCSFVIPLLSPARMLWEIERSSEWWEKIVNGTFVNHDWLTNFRMSQSTFNYICKLKLKRLTRSCGIAYLQK